MFKLVSMITVSLFVGISMGCVSMTPGEQAARAPVTTIWGKLGIPQAYAALTDNHVNRRGDHPQFERKPRLLRIADPANLESPNAAIQAAAEIKQQEDLAEQKVKALKYLGEIGCGCYDADGKVEAAILAGLNDCTTSVRLAALDAIGASVQDCREQCGRRQRGRLHGGRDLVSRLSSRGCGCSGASSCSSCSSISYGACSGCGDCDDSACCTEQVRKKLADMAYGMDDRNCYNEPVAEIRARAAHILENVCPPPYVDPVDEPEIEQTPIEGIPTSGAISNHWHIHQQHQGGTVPITPGRTQQRPAGSTLGDQPR